MSGFDGPNSSYISATISPYTFHSKYLGCRRHKHHMDILAASLPSGFATFFCIYLARPWPCCIA